MTLWRRSGLSLVEIVFSLAILAVAFLSMISIASLALRSQAKSQTNQTAVQVAHRQINRAIIQVQSDTPAGSYSKFWTSDFPCPTTPWTVGNDTVGSTPYSYAVYASTVTNSSGAPLGGTVPPSGPGNRMKQVDVVVTWWSTDGSREGYGRLQTQMTRLINETDTNTTP